MPPQIYLPRQKRQMIAWQVGIWVANWKFGWRIPSLESNWVAKFHHLSQIGGQIGWQVDPKTMGNPLRHLGSNENLPRQMDQMGMSIWGQFNAKCLFCLGKFKGNPLARQIVNLGSNEANGLDFGGKLTSRGLLLL